MEKPSLPKGMRDFAPNALVKRQFILETIKGVFRKYSFLQLETPAMENLSTLMGKYGNEGEQLIFKVLNSGDYLKDVASDMLNKKDAAMLTPHISGKGLRYDLTVPFARYVALNRHDIAFPFRRFQIQPVWRADRPQKGRYREFYQCDADIVGTQSLLCEAEIIAMIIEVCQGLGIKDYRIRINHRGILSGLAQRAGITDEDKFFSVLDKWAKIGAGGVRKNLLNLGIETALLDDMFDIFGDSYSNEEKIRLLADRIGHVKEGAKGISDIKEIQHFLSTLNISDNAFSLDMTLARGLSYYTGTLFEVTVNNVAIGSISGGGRYDNLTEVFGLPDVSGVGLSFGVDRLYDVMDTLGLFPDSVGLRTAALIAHFSPKNRDYSLKIVAEMRGRGCCVEVYPDCSRIKKQLDYARKNNIPFVVFIGDEEMETGQLTLKNMRTGEQRKCNLEEVIKII